jgi:hypothetical protein
MSPLCTASGISQYCKLHRYSILVSNQNPTTASVPYSGPLNPSSSSIPDTLAPPHTLDLRSNFHPRNACADLAYGPSDTYGSLVDGYLDSRIVAHFEKLEAFLNCHRTPYLAGAKPTVADFHLWEMLDVHDKLAVSKGNEPQNPRNEPEPETLNPKSQTLKPKSQTRENAYSHQPHARVSTGEILHHTNRHRLALGK